MLTEGLRRATELDESKQYLIGSLPRQLETNAGIAGFLLTAEFFGLGIDYDVRLPGHISGVTLDAGQRARSRRAPRPGSRHRRRRRSADGRRRHRPSAGQGGVLRRRLHADLSRARRFQGEGYAALLRRARRDRATPTRVRRRRGRLALPILDDRRRADLRPRTLRPLHARRSSSTWAAAAPA